MKLTFVIEISCCLEKSTGHKISRSVVSGHISYVWIPFASLSKNRQLTYIADSVVFVSVRFSQ